jgi:hypothetical protein
MKNPSDRAGVLLGWLEELAGDVPHLEVVERHRPYWSQRKAATAPVIEASWPTIVARVRLLIRELMRDELFAQTLGYDCVDNHGEGTTPQFELDHRLGKGDLWDSDTYDWAEGEWSEDDLCDVIEVFHDLAARPIGGWVHDYDRSWHPLRFSRKSGQALYRWRINQLLATTVWPMRIADEGEDIGRMIQPAPEGVVELVHEAMAGSSGPTRDDVTHAIALFRSRGATRSDKRSAVGALAGVLERRRALLKQELWRKDEGALFQIANEFDVRHRDAKQRTDYDDAFLEWIFYFYLGTVNLTNRLIARQAAGDADGTSPFD